MDEPIYAVELKQAADVFNASQENNKLFNKLINTFGPKKVTFDIISRVSKNIKLFRLFDRGPPGEKFINIKDALEAVSRMEEKILIYFRELDLYKIYDPLGYCSLYEELQSYNNEGNIISFHFQQILLDTFPQKPIFICYGGRMIVEKICRYITKRYNCKVEIVLKL